MKKLLTLIIAGGLSIQAFAQSDLTLYNFNSVAQSLHVNPAYPQQTRVWVALPVISGVQTYYHNSGFKLIDIFETGTDINANIDEVILGLDDNSVITTNQSIDLLGVGFRVKNGFVTLGAQQVVDYTMTYPVDLMKLIWFGNADEQYRTTNLSKFELESMVRTNYYIGYQAMVNDKLSLGGRFKYIIGQGHGYTERMNASVETTDNSNLLVQTDIEIRTAGISNYIDANPFDVKTSVFPENSGFGIDLGAHYTINDRWNVSASVLDLGFISWKANRRDYISEGEFEFEGLNADLSEDEPVESFDDVIDTLKAAFEFKEIDGGEGYTKSLPTRVFVSGNYKLSERHSFGGLYHLKMWNGRTYHDFSVNYQGRLARAFQYTVSYSVIDGTYNNVGLGLQVKAGPLQIYAISDNVLHIVQYENLQTTNVRAGLNITLFDKKEKKRKKDKDAEENIEEEVIVPTEDI